MAGNTHLRAVASLEVAVYCDARGWDMDEVGCGMAGGLPKELWAPWHRGPQGQGLTHPFSRHLACREGKFSQIRAIYPCGKPFFQLWGKSNIIYPSLLMLPAAAASPAVVGEHFGSTCSVKQLQEIPSFLLPASQV